jgi:hypothetical protein
MEFVKKIITSAIKPILHIFSLSLKNGLVPQQLKIAKVIPVYKGGVKTSMDNYRPISLLSNFSKILEKIVSNRLTLFLDTHCILSNDQFGFRKNHATAHPMILFNNFISKALNNNEHAIAIFCDLRKAFDTVDHKILLSKPKKIGVEGNALLWFKSYLFERKQFVCINSCNSNFLDIKIGVPQGSILGPLLFLIYINDLPSSSLLKAFLFADDTQALAKGSNFDELVAFVNTEFHKMVTYFRSHKLALHPDKTKFMIFSSSPAIANSNPSIVINCNNPDDIMSLPPKPLCKVTASCPTPAIKSLGVYFDPQLNFKHHLKTISTKLSSALYIMRAAKSLLSQKALRAVYFAIFHSHLIYGIQIWSGTSASLLSEITKKQKQAIRIVCQAKYNAHTEPLFKSCNILPLHKLTMYFKLQFMHQYVNNYLPSAFTGTWPINRERRNEDDRELRNNNDFFIPLTRLVSLDKHPLYSFPRTWNDFADQEMKNTRNKQSFNRKLKIHLLDTLNAEPTCNSLYCHTCSHNN